MNADPIHLSFPGPRIEAALTWDQLRDYLRANGWERRVERDGVELWMLEGRRGEPGDPSVYVGAFRGESEERAIHWAVSALAMDARCSAGEMLTRIAKWVGATVTATR